MLALTLLSLASFAYARNFNITYLSVPDVVPPGQNEAEIECRYDANFTILSWFKGPNEFFRYKPGTTPSTRSFPVTGVGSIQLEACGPTACRLRLGALTEEASGLYRCDIERNVPPYLFETRSANMEVHGMEHRKPLLEGFANEFSEGDLMQAYCRTTPEVEIRWYLNGKEVNELRGSATFKMKTTRLIFSGLPPTVTIQCAESRNGKLSGSKEATARWKGNSSTGLGGNLRTPNKSDTVEKLNIILLTWISLIAFMF